jgi:mono/diheme cytochrome c family protein
MQDNYNRGGFYAFLFSIVFTLAFMFYISLMHKGIDLKEVHIQTPNDNAQAAAVVADVDVTNVKEPWVSSPDMIAHGKKVFATNCAMCHGAEGKGDGPAGVSLNPRPRNFIEGKWKQGGRSQDLFKTLQTGIPGSSMVSFSALPANDRWSLIHFIRSITQNKIPDDPKALEAYAKTAK